MPDITICKNEKCPLKSKCYRYMARPNSIHQSYGCFPVGKKGKGKKAIPYCEFFYEIDKDDKFIKLRKAGK